MTDVPITAAAPAVAPRASFDAWIIQETYKRTLADA